MNENTLLIADKPLLLGGKPEKITTQEFEMLISKEMGTKFTWLESFDSASHSLQSPKNLGLVLCKTNEKVKRGVFASKFIKKDTFIRKYTGKKIDAYTAPDQTRGYVLAAFDRAKACITFDAYEMGNITRFFNHLPENSTKRKFFLLSEQVKVSPETEAEIVTANLYLRVNESHQFEFYASRDIQPGEQVGFDYDPEYQRKMLNLENLVLLNFDKFGNVLLPKIDKHIYYLTIPVANNASNGNFECIVATREQLTTLILHTASDTTLRKVIGKSFTPAQLFEMFDIEKIFRHRASRLLDYALHLNLIESIGKISEGSVKGVSPAALLEEELSNESLKNDNDGDNIQANIIETPAVSPMAETNSIDVAEASASRSTSSENSLTRETQKRNKPCSYTNKQLAYFGFFAVSTAVGVASMVGAKYFATSGNTNTTFTF